MPQKKWINLSTDYPEQVKKLSHDLQIPLLLVEIILRRGYKTQQEIEIFLKPELNNLRNPLELRHIKEAVDLLKSSITSGKRIIILGDYDVDGITATALMIEFLRKCGDINVDYFIPNRLKHGYGLTKTSTDVLLEMKPDLVITVDNGITAADEVLRLNNEGIQTIITDHHLAESSLLPSGIVVNPNHPECKYPFKQISGCGVALKLILALRKSLRDSGFWKNESQEPNLRDSLDLVAMGTVADMVSLVDENRILTFHGLIVMNEKPRLAIQVFKRLKNVKNITSRTISFQFSPMLNAAGRIHDANIAVKFLLSSDKKEAEKIYLELESANLDRRKKEGEMLELAMSLSETQKKFPALILSSPKFHEGINGIVATRLVEKFYKPAIVLSQVKEKLKGSGRSIPELNLKEALSECSNLLERFGGHSAAAGFSLEQENLNAFRECFFEFCNKRISKSLEPLLKLDGQLELTEISNIFVEQFELLEPFGLGNDEPIFRIKTPEISFFLIKGKHVKWEINDNLEIIGWNLARNFEKKLPSQLAVNLGYNEFRGKRKIQLTIQDSLE